MEYFIGFFFSSDVVSHSKYHCTHVSGLHAVAIPFIQALEENTDASKCFRFQDKSILSELKVAFIIAIILILLYVNKRGIYIYFIIKLSLLK